MRVRNFDETENVSSTRCPARLSIFRLDHNGRTDGLTDGPTDRRTKPLIEMRVYNLKEAG